MLLKSSAFYAFVIISFWIFFGLFSTLKAQNKDAEYRRVSISVRAGTTFENGANGFNLFDSRFNSLTKTTGILGLGVQYAITPAWSIEGGYSYTQIRDVAGSFRTNMNIFSFKNIINLNQILFINRISNSVNPYLTGGIGYDIYRFESSATTAENASLSYNVGAGIAYKLSPTVDLFTHYEYNLASNKVDNQIGSGGGLRADVLTNFTGGVRINFGKKGTIHPSWRPVPVEVSRSDYEYLLSEEKRAKTLEDELNKLKAQLNKKDLEHKKELKAYAGTIDSLNKEITHLKNQLQVTKDSLASAPSKTVITDCSCEKASIPAGHYVQVFASLSLNSTHIVRTRAINKLKELLELPEEEVFIAKRKQYYEVLIGSFTNFQRAKEVVQIMKEFHHDAFIITFPRPVNLLELYDDIQKVN